MALKNRINELRTARGWSFEQLASHIDDSVQGSTVHKLETGTMKLTTEWMEKLAAAFGVDPVAIIDDRARGGFAEDVSRYADGDAPPGRVMTVAKAGRALYRVTSNALDEIGILKGDLVEVNEAADAIKDMATGDVVIANAESPSGGPITTVMREFIEPSLLITNSRSENELPINMRNTRVDIAGIVVDVHRQIARKR